MVEKANKRELILTAARDIFGEKGYHAATSEEIAKRAGVGKGTIYQYFESKRDIFLQMHILYLKQYSENVSALICESDTFEVNLRRIIRFHLENLHDLMQFGVQFMSRMKHDNTTCEENCAMMEELKTQLGIEQYQLIELAAQQGEIRHTDAQLIVSCLSGMFVGIAHMVGPKRLTEEEMKRIEDELAMFVMHGLVV